MNPDLSVKIGRIRLQNPVMVASGTFGYAEEFSDFMDLKKLGAVVSKTITLRPRRGNPSPRTCETPAGLLNSIGLENPGLEVFISEKLPLLKQAGAPVIVSIASEGGSEEFLLLARKLDKIKDVSAVELNISCPNIKEKKLPGVSRRLVSQDPAATYKLVRSVRKATSKTLITKLSPNVTDIAGIAVAAERGGSDAVSLVNTLSGMCIDISNRRPKIAGITAGLSGPAIRPVAVRMVWEASRRVSIPVIGMGGIMNANDALEFFIAGAAAVSVGTANFIDPRCAMEIVSGLKGYLKKSGMKNMKQLRGSLICET